MSAATSTTAGAGGGAANAANAAARAGAGADAAVVAVGLIEDDAPYRRYVAGVLEASGRYRVAAEAGSVEEAGRWPETVGLAAALVDVAMPGAPGTSAVAGLLARFPGLAVVMLTARDDEATILEAIRAGAGGYILKGTGSAELVATVDDVRAGGAPMSPAIARKVLWLMRTAPSAATVAQAVSPVRPAGEAIEGLTPREAEVLARVAAGEADKEVAAQLGISVPVVKAHLGKIYVKWRVRSRTEAAIKFTRLKK